MEPVKKHRIVFVALIANLGNFSFGTCLGWSSPLIPKLAKHTNDSPLDFAITKEQEGWITSIITIGSLITSLIAGPVAGKFGRKITLLSSSVFFGTSFVLLLVGTQVWIIYIARLVQGVGAGLVVTTLPVYIGEIATDDIRGALGSLMALFMVGGIVYSYSIGPYVHYMTLQWCCLAIPIIFLATFSFMPESPYFCAAKHHRSDGIKSLQFLRGQSATDVEEEMSKIQSEVDDAMTDTGAILDIVRVKGYRKAFLICCGLLSLQQLCGTSVVSFNSQSIFSSAKSSLDPAEATIVLGLVQFISNMVTPFVIEQSGRKIILVISAVGMCLSLMTIGAYFYIQAFHDASSIQWLPVPALIIFNLLYSFGFGPLPWVMLGEMLPANIKPIATAIACACCFLSGFVATRWFPELNALGPYYAFWIFGSMCVVALLFIVFVMIETKGLSLKSIQEKLHA